MIWIIPEEMLQYNNYRMRVSMTQIRKCMILASGIGIKMVGRKILNLPSSTGIPKVRLKLTLNNGSLNLLSPLINGYFLLFFWPCSLALWVLSSPIKDWTNALSSESMEFLTTGHPENSLICGCFSIENTMVLHCLWLIESEDAEESWIWKTDCKLYGLTPALFNSIATISGNDL